MLPDGSDNSVQFSYGAFVQQWERYGVERDRIWDVKFGFSGVRSLGGFELRAAGEYSVSLLQVGYML